LRRPLGVLNGIIDKLLITHSATGDVEIEIIDFKTNRIAFDKSENPLEPHPTASARQRRGNSPSTSNSAAAETFQSSSVA
jgi:hypothetical protein